MSAFQELKQAYDELVELISAADIQALVNLDTIFDQFTSRLKKIIDIDAIALFLLEGEQKDVLFSFSLHHGFAPYLQEGFELKVRDVYEWVLSKGNNVFFPSEIAPGLNDLYIPLSIFERKLGIIHILTPTDPLEITQHQKTVLTIFANHVAVALEHRRIISQEKQSYEELLQHEKINSFGYMLSGIIHELNSPLTSILGYSDLILDFCRDMQEEGLEASEIADFAKTLSKEAIRASDIVKSLLKFVRKSDRDRSEKQLLNINEVLNNSLDFLQYNFRVHHITLEKKLEPTLPMVQGDPIQLQQAIFNVLSNAEQALIAGQVLHKNLAVRTWSSDNKVYLEVRDNGPGIPVANLSRIFDPFFTTKPEGDGTGLGLSLCFKIVTEHKGRVWVKNSQPAGAVFCFEFPAVKEKRKSQRLRERTSIRQSEAVGHILIVDDEESILKLLTRILVSVGHQVSGARSGEEACQKLLEDSFDLILSDIHMPHLSGLEFYQFILDRKPDLASIVVFTTGDVISAETHAFLEKNQLKCIYKPFHARDIQAFVEDKLKHKKGLNRK